MCLFLLCRAGSRLHMVRASPQLSSEYSSRIARARACTRLKQNKGNKRDIHKPVPEERPKDAAGEEKSANPPIRSALRKPQNINFKQTSSGCHSTIVSIPSVSVVEEGREGRGGRSVENTKHLFNVSTFFIHKGLLQKHLVHLVPIHQLSSPCCP